MLKFNSDKISNLISELRGATSRLKIISVLNKEKIFFY